jgi:hypothetical protein
MSWLTLPRRRTRPLVALGTMVLLLAVSGCAGTVSLQPAADATNPGCAEIIVRLPSQLPSDADNQARRETDAQATAAWGSPASILLHCGVQPIGPTTLPCLNVNGVDWIEDDSQKPNYRFTTFGRTPATEVVINYDVVSGTSTLVDLGGIIQNIPQTDKCTDVQDLQDVPTGDPPPGATPAN